MVVVVGVVREMDGGCGGGVNSDGGATDGGLVSDVSNREERDDVDDGGPGSRALVVVLASAAVTCKSQSTQHTLTILIMFLKIN